MNICSIVVAVSNGLQRNKFFFSRLFKNTEGPFELIIVDNGTTDGTASYLNQLPNRKLLRFPLDMGLARAWNSALRVATGQSVVFVNTSCALPPKWLTNLDRAQQQRKKRIGAVRSLDRQTVLNMRGVFGRFADTLKSVPGTPFTSEEELNNSYQGSFDQYALSLARRFSSLKLTSAHSGCVLVSKEVFRKGLRFPEGYTSSGSDIVTNFLSGLEGSSLRPLVSPTVYTHL